MKALKKTLAVASAVAIAAAAAAGTMLSASAASTVSMTQMNEIVYDGSSVVTANIDITADEAVHSLGFGFTVADNMEVDYDGSAVLMADGNNWWYAYSAASDKAAGKTIDSYDVIVTLTADDIATLESGTDVTYTLASSVVNFATGELGAVFNDAEKEDITVGAAVITIKAPVVETSTEATTTTTEATTEATTTETEEVVTTTAAVEVATVTTVTTSGSPKTSDALPIAGVVVAVAVIGGVAFVSKKRK